MKEPTNGRDMQYRAPAQPHAFDESGITIPLGDLAARRRREAERPPANATELQEAWKTGAQAQRHWLAQELHDSVSPVLHSIGLLASAARAQLQPDQEKARKALDLALSLTQKQLDEMRQLVAYMLADSLVEALSSTVDFTAEYGGVEVAKELCPEPALAVSVKLGLYKIAREALHNAVKHAPGCRLQVRLEERAGCVVLDVIDDGPGFRPGAVRTGHCGLVSMRERAASIGATLDIDSAPGAGTRVRVAVPLAS